jgi:integrase/recombinase XerC
MPPAGPAAGQRATDPLPPALLDALAAFERHLSLELSRSRHTVRAYTGDVGDLLRHAAGFGITEPAGLDLAVLRSWLARSRSAGAARTTLARRGSSARVFTAWACRRGVLERDVGALLATPKGHRTLPDVLRPDEAPGWSSRWTARAPSSCGTGRCWSCSTRPGIRSASCAGWTWTTWTASAGWSA